MREMTQQEAFNKVSRHLLTQNKRAEFKGFGCVYRGDGGTKCAIGCLIPNKYYRDEMDNDGDGIGDSINVEELLYKYPNLPLRFRHLPTPFLEELQDIHDGVDVKKWKDELKKFGYRHKLSIAVLKNYG